MAGLFIFNDHRPFSRTAPVSGGGRARHSVRAVVVNPNAPISPDGGQRTATPYPHPGMATRCG
jgi:hypothetical protein